ncbi:hypothetical protein ABZT51_17595 [Streptomyces sp. NPDC005373]|uniref:hypothetical protein n=1 Tax=Streptomyces sp. NPDC005373 TaxID=3156879 RepID=UPI0033B0B6BB
MVNWTYGLLAPRLWAYGLLAPRLWAYGLLAPRRWAAAHKPERGEFVGGGFGARVSMFDSRTPSLTSVVSFSIPAVAG